MSCVHYCGKIGIWGNLVNLMKPTYIFHDAKIIFILNRQRAAPYALGLKATIRLLHADGESTPELILLSLQTWWETDISSRTLRPDVSPCILHTGHFPLMYDERVRVLPPRVWRRRRHAGAARLRYRRGGDRQATDAASDLLQRLTTTTTAVPLFRASRCVRCRRCSRCPPGTCMSPRWTAWNRGFAALVGRNHPSVWCAIESLQPVSYTHLTLPTKRIV